MQYSMYHPSFRKRRLHCLAEAGYHCERCGVAHRSFAFSKEGEIYIVYLTAAHVFENDKMNPDAHLVCLCPRCHYYFDHPRGDTAEGVADWSFIGKVAKSCIEKESQTLEAKRRNAEQADCAQKEDPCEYLTRRSYPAIIVGTHGGDSQ